MYYVYEKSSQHSLFVCVCGFQLKSGTSVTWRTRLWTGLSICPWALCVWWYVLLSSSGATCQAWCSKRFLKGLQTSGWHFIRETTTTGPATPLMDQVRVNHYVYLVRRFKFTLHFCPIVSFFFSPPLVLRGNFGPRFPAPSGRSPLRHGREMDSERTQRAQPVHGDGPRDRTHFGVGALTSASCPHVTILQETGTKPGTQLGRHHRGAAAVR